MDKQQEFLLNRMKVGQLLKAMRPITQIEMAMKIGYANATFTCAVEKGTSTIPPVKIMDFAANYLPEEKHMLAAVIYRKVHPDHWDVAVQIFGGIMGGNKTSAQISKEIDSWFDKKLKEYGVNI